MTHAEIVAVAAMWLRSKGCSVVITEMASQAGETPDALGWRAASRSILIECKASRADFLRDKKKFFRREGYGMGYSRYYMAPAKIIHPDEIPPGWGLLEVHRSSIHTMRRSEPFPDADLSGEIKILISALRRVGQDPPPGLSVRFYKYKTKNRATLGINTD